MIDHVGLFTTVTSSGRDSFSREHDIPFFSLVFELLIFSEDLRFFMVDR